MSTHFSWLDVEKNYFKQMDELYTYQLKITRNKYIKELQHGVIPVYQINNSDLSDIGLQKDIYNSFHNMSGCLIIKNVYSSDLMEEYNKWCQDWLTHNEHDPNGVHPKQKDKYLINDIISRLSKDSPTLFMKLLNNNVLTSVLDVLLGFMKYGSATCHWIQPGGDKQLSHVDYPIHIGSGKFWENSVGKCQHLMTRKQINDIMKFYSCQVIIASDAMDHINGSTEVVASSHLLNDLDLNIHDKMFYDMIESQFKNVILGQGDILIFNRALCHRGGKNMSLERRNSLIFQCVYIWGIGQEVINYDVLMENIKENSEYLAMTEKEKTEFKLRFKCPYPLDVKQST